MTEELKTDDVVEQSAAESVAESAPASESEHEENQNGVQKRINEITAQKYEERRRAEEAERKARELEKKLAESQASSASNAVAPHADNDLLPPDPDMQYDDPEAYRRKMHEYNVAVANKAIEDRERQRQKDLELQAARDQEAEIQRQFLEKAQRDNIDPEDAFQAVKTLHERGISDSLSDAVINHPNSAAIFDYLAKNPAEFESLNKNQGVIQAWEAVKGIESKALSKKTTSAPEPVPELTGSGVKEPDAFSQKYPDAYID